MGYEESSASLFNKERSPTPFMFECDGLKTIEGWEFQECSDKKVVLTKISEVGSWTLDPEYKFRTIKDAYAYALKRRLSEPKKRWEVKLFDPIEASTVGKDRETKKSSIREILCLAEMYDKIRGDPTLSKSKYKAMFTKELKELAECRRNYGI